MSPQSMVGHYRIISKLGEGGMGAVYRATDTKLNREVAIKVLPPAFAEDAARMQRFKREAQVLASLNHPNIAAIYGIEQGAIVMELVEGEDLKGPLPLETALDYARQIAAGLEAAHEKGVVHRDLKPANIKVTPGGQIKLLDFGLAKATEASAAPATAGLTMSPTISLAMTQAGVILGTAAYMSPEQAKGKPVDRRADIWAFGVVLVEMLTGRAMFSGETVSETLAAVIMKEPEIPAEIPQHVRVLLRRCLDKDPQYRLQSIGEARIAIDRSATLESPAAPAPTMKKGAPWWTVAVAAAIPALVMGGLLWRATRPVERPLQRFLTDLGPEADPGPRGAVPLAISPDGRRIVYPARSKGGVRLLAIRLLDQAKPTVLPGTEFFGAPFFSPDGQWIGFFGNRKLWKVSVSGGAPIPLYEAIGGSSAAWGDGFIYGAFEGDFLSRVPETGGKPEPVTKPDERNPRRTDRWPQLLPGGEVLLFTSGFTQNNYEDANIAAYSLKTQQYKTVHRGGYFGRYLPSGHLLYVHQGTLFAIAFDPVRLETRGTPLPMLDDLSANPSVGAGQFDFSTNGILVYHASKATLETGAVLWMDKDGKQEKILSGPVSLTPKLSPDGKLLALAVNGEVVVHDPARGSTTVVARATPESRAADAVPGTGLPGYPVWMPDGRHIIYSDRQKLWWTRSDGAGRAETLLAIPQAIAQSIAPDGKNLAFHQADNSAGGDRELYTVSLDLSDPEHAKAGKPEPFVLTQYADVDPAFSPDGRWLAYTTGSATSGYHVFVRPFPEGAKGGTQVQISAAPGRFPLWSRTAKEIFCMNNEDKIMVVPYSVTGGTFRASKPELWSNTPVGRTANAIPLDIAPDGKRFVVFPGVQAAPGGAQENVRVTFLLNFFDELKRRLP